MRKKLQNMALIAGLGMSVISVNAQTVSSIENLTLTPNSYWNGATSNPTVSTSGSFSSGNVVFPNSYNGNYGGYWESGWSYSNMKDSTTVGSTNQYSAITGIGYNGSSNYVVAQPALAGSILRLNSTAVGKQLDGFYLTNSTFAALSMKMGDNFAKKFGGTTGNDPDWFKLKITKYLGGSLQVNDTVVVYLADFRFANNSQDYILKTWKYVDLKPLGNVDSLIFTLSSSDNTGGYMNTPSYFCADNFTTLNTLAMGIEPQETSAVNFVVYPNPASNYIKVNTSVEFTKIAITNQLGQIVLEGQDDVINLSELPIGVYGIQLYNNNRFLGTKKFIKE